MPLNKETNLYNQGENIGLTSLCSEMHEQWGNYVIMAYQLLMGYLMPDFD